jgi:hypothetical protein
MEPEAWSDLPAPPAAGVTQQDVVLHQVGNIAVTATEIIASTVRHPLAGSTWTVEDHTKVVRRTSAAGVIMAICTFWLCGLGLLFLLLKEDKLVGFVQVTVSGPGFHAATQVNMGAWAKDPINATARIAGVESTVSSIRAQVVALG